MNTNAISIIFLALFAAIIGSFLNVVIYRLPIMLNRTEKHFNLAHPRSRCCHCKTTLSIWQNIPLISYLALKGRCAFCRKRIPPRYFFVELMSIFISFACLYHFQWTWQLWASLAFSWILLASSFIDLEHLIIPNRLNYTLLILGLIVSLIDFYPGITFTDSLLGAIAGYTLLYVVAGLFKLLRKQEAMGHGDFKLLAALGAWTGWQSLLFIILFSSIIGLVYGIFVAVKAKNKNIRIPFGPFLAFAGWLALLLPTHITWI